MVYLTQFASYSDLDAVFELPLSTLKKDIICSTLDSDVGGSLNVITFVCDKKGQFFGLGRIVKL